MKKKLLFVIPSLVSGGAEKSLITLFDIINYEKYDVDLLPLFNKGLFKDLINKKVNKLTVSEDFKQFNNSIVNSCKYFYKNKKYHIILHRILYSAVGKLLNNKAKAEYYMWKHVSNTLESNTKKYDVAIGFLEGTANYYVVDKVNALKKIGWIHIDYKTNKKSPKIDRRYFERFDYIVTVSSKCKDILEECFPKLVPKFKVIHNIVSVSLINKLANLEKVFNKNSEIKLLSVGRLNYQKNYELAIDTCKRLIEDGYSIKWYVIGEGVEKERIDSLIKEYNLENNFILLGTKSNPYPYIAACDIFIQTSRFEGKSIAIDEAKILHKPIVVTNFDTVYDQIQDNVNGLICEMNSIDLSKKIKALINNSDLKDRLSNNLMNENLDNSYEIEKLYDLFEM